MSTRPDTIAAALADSPPGSPPGSSTSTVRGAIAAATSSPDSTATRCAPILTLYWVTESIGTSFRQYLDWPQNSKRPTITVPVAVTLTSEPPFELFPRSIAERAASDLRQYSTPRRGGHFLAFEEPQLIADELGAFMRSVADG